MQGGQRERLLQAEGTACAKAQRHEMAWHVQGTTNSSGSLKHEVQGWGEWEMGLEGQVESGSLEVRGTLHDLLVQAPHFMTTEYMTQTGTVICLMSHSKLVADGAEPRSPDVQIRRKVRRAEEWQL